MASDISIAGRYLSGTLSSFSIFFLFEARHFRTNRLAHSKPDAVVFSPLFFVRFILPQD
jgi:hypothetical protein